MYLDEIGELPLELQSRLLAVLERREVRRIGSTRPRPVAAWFIAATNRDLDDMASHRCGFRSDLYFRLKVLSLDIPPLRERLDDLAPLFEHFSVLTSRRYGMPVPRRFLPRSWIPRAGTNGPGNVRELAHMVERADPARDRPADRRRDARSGGLRRRRFPPTPAIRGTSWTDLTLEEAERRLIIARVAPRPEAMCRRPPDAWASTRMALRYRIREARSRAPAHERGRAGGAGSVLPALRSPGR